MCFWAVSFHALKSRDASVPSWSLVQVCFHVLFTMHTLSLSLSLSWPSHSVSNYRGGQCSSPASHKASPPRSVTAEKSNHSAAQTRNQGTDLNFYLPSSSLPSSPLSTPDSHTHPVNHQVLNQLPSKSLKSICISHPSCHCPSSLTSTSHKNCSNSLIGLLSHSCFCLIDSVPLPRAVFTQMWSCHFPD